MSDPPSAPVSVTDDTASRTAGSDARSDADDDSEFRTATRLLRLLKLALGALVSFLTALKLLGAL